MGSLMGRMIKTSVVTATTSMIANMLNLNDTKVGKILGFAVPMITFVTADDPKISDLFFKDIKKKKGLFSKKDEKTGLFSPKKAEKDFFDVFGDKGHKMSRLIAKETESTEEEVNGVLGLTFGVMEAGLGRAMEEEEVDEKGFNNWFKKEAEEEKKRSPSLFRMMTKAIF